MPLHRSQLFPQRYSWQRYQRLITILHRTQNFWSCYYLLSLKGFGTHLRHPQSFTLPFAYFHIFTVDLLLMSPLLPLLCGFGHIIVPPELFLPTHPKAFGTLLRYPFIMSGRSCFYLLTIRLLAPPYAYCFFSLYIRDDSFFFVLRWLVASFFLRSFIYVSLFVVSLSGR